MSKIFITGVAGMIGSNVARSFLKDNFEVIGIDNLWRGDKKNIADFVDMPNFTFRHSDIISDRDWYRDLTSEDVLIHIADIVAGIGYVFSNEWDIFQKNILINTSIARIVNEKEPKQLVYLGTACSYPQEMQRSVSSSQLAEKDKYPADPESGYGWSKLIGEIEFSLAVKELDTRLTVIDLHNVYGWPCVYGDATSQVIPALIFKSITSKDGKLTVWGDGSQGRAFVHISDVVSAIRLSLNYTGLHTTIMIGPEYCTTISEVANIIQKHPRIHINEIIFDTDKPMGDIGRFADHSLAKSELGWKPKVNFVDGLNELIDRILDDYE